jgi:flagellar biosynthesis protein FlhG
MKDQAYGLRLLHKAEAPHKTAPPKRNSRVIAVTSGKGGVGKTNLVANVAVAMAAQGTPTLVLDGDLSLGNLDVLLGIRPDQTLADVIAQRARLEDVIYQGLAGVRVIPAAMGLQEITRMDHETRQRICDEILNLATDDSVLLIDTGAGVSDNVIDFVISAGQAILVTSREPTAIIDAYAVVKILHNRGYEGEIGLVVNMVNNAEEGVWVFDRLHAVIERHLESSLRYLGSVLRDASVQRAVCQQMPIVLEKSTSPAALGFRRLATRLLEKLQHPKDSDHEPHPGSGRARRSH